MRQIPQPDGKIKYLLTERELRRHEGTSSADEVKRLKTFMVCYRKDRDEAEAEVDRLEAINADLLAALKGVMPWASKAVADHPYNQIAGQRVLDAAVEVIERVDGES